MPSGPATQPQSAPNVVVEERSRRPAFRPRQYPMLFGVMIFFYVLAGLAVLSFLGWMGLIWSTVAVMPMGMEREAMGATLGGGAFAGAAMSLWLLIVHAMWAAVCVLTAEMVKLALDVQLNTQETAYNTRHRN